tara:strand:- start:1499 stop:2341 length:843 start_codon:yes stop_codon:yes gene_type:complete
MNSFSSGLYIVSTPIGNLDDITLRSIEVLKKSDIILCEDTRRTLKLLNHFNIKKKLISYHKFNEIKELKNIIQHLKEGKILSLVSDAGTPTLSDPGMILVNKCIESDIRIIPIPGPSSITASMSIAGFDDKFLFYGFLPKKKNELSKVLKSIKDLNYSLIFFVSGIKINFYLDLFKKFFLDRDILIAREITKIHETFYRNSVKSIEPFKGALKGELTIVISKKYNNNKNISDEDIKKLSIKYLKKYSLKDAADLIAKNKEVSRKRVYGICLEIKNDKKNY